MSSAAESVAEHDAADLLDAHAHVWDAARLSYPWLADVPALPPSATPAQLAEATGASGHIFVEAGAAPGDGVAEARAAAASDWPTLRGIVAAADLRDPALEATLEVLRGIPLVVGIRFNLQGEPEGALRDPLLRGGLAAVAAHGFSFDACVRHTQLGELATLVEAVPDARVVLDHLGKPAVDAGLESESGRRWRDGIERLAQSRGVFVKVSGLSAEASSEAVLLREGADFVGAGVAAFGAGRSMIGSDWPVSTSLGAAASFPAWIALVRSAVPADAWPKLAATTAGRFYLSR